MNSRGVFSPRVSDLAITTTDHPTPEQRDVIVGGLVAYNDAAAQREHYGEVAVLAHSGDQLVGGLLGFTSWNWLFIKQLWIDETFRGRGLGRQLIAAAEAEAVRRGCAHVHCDTFGFQALPFYQKLGFEIFGQLADYPPGHTRYFLQKRNLARSSR